MELLITFTGKTFGSYESPSIISIRYDYHMGYNLLPSSEKSRLDFARNTCFGHYNFPCYLVFMGVIFLDKLCSQMVSWDQSLTMLIFTRIYIISTHSLIWEIIGDGHFATCLHFFTPEQKLWARICASWGHVEWMTSTSSQSIWAPKLCH